MAAATTLPRESHDDAPQVDLAPLRCATAGSVDDGKSTLLGRLLYDTKSLMTDQLAHVEEASRRRGLARTDLALLTDGLRAEREQGITIDVAWRYFATPRRRFVLADAPGHFEYTRNMITAASVADVAIVLVDARAGLVEQTRRHLFLTRLLAVPALAVVVNKMDLVGFDHGVFARVRDEVAAYLSALPVPGPGPSTAFFPVSALRGDNLVDRSDATPWYDGPTLLAHLEALPTEAARPGAPLRFPVQWVIRAQDDVRHGYRAHAGRVASGTLRVGQRVRVLPSGASSTVRAIDAGGAALTEARAGRSCAIHLEDDVALTRGDLVVAEDEPAPTLTDRFLADVAWVHDRAAKPREVFVLKHGTLEVRAVIEGVEAGLDVVTGAAVPPARDLPALNDLARVSVRTFEPLAIDRYTELRATGSFLLVDVTTGATRAAGMIREPLEPAA